MLDIKVTIDPKLIGACHAPEEYSSHEIPSSPTPDTFYADAEIYESDD